MTLTFDQQVALVTGGAGGIGAVVCRELAARGVAVAVADIALEKAAAVAGDLVAEGGRAVGVGLDVTASADVDALVERLTADYGRVDILVNCAGFPVDRPLVKMTDDEWRTVLDVCLFGTFATSRAVAPGMIERQYGRIVNLSSRAYLGNPGQANYSAAKAGVIGLTKSLSKELGRHGVTVNAIAPGMIETEMVRSHPKFEMIAERAIADNSVKRLGVPEDVASAVLYLASPEAGFVSGDVLHVSGGRFG
jgi:3-oxoacyl-[acyl-carrier protein] reductase